jgi:hypothetical protein
MSKWRKPLKNKRRYDPRYFSSEREEGKEAIVENSVQQEQLKKNFHDFSFDSWLGEGADKGTPSWSKAKKSTENNPIDYDHDDEDEKIGGEVVEEEKETVIGDEEEKESYGEPLGESEEIEES